MLKKNGQVVFGVVVSLLLLVFIAFITSAKLPLQTIYIIFLIAPLVFIITFLNTDVALIILIFSMLLSPELKIAEIPQRVVVMRVDDILLIVVFFSWLAKMAINKRLGLLRRTPINLLIIAYISVCLLSTGIGIFVGHIQPSKSFFYILKYAEYFMLYFLVINNIRNKKQIKTFMTAFFIVCGITCTYAMVTLGKFERATAPFEGICGEPNTLGAYLILLIAMCIGFILYSPLSTWRFSSGALACLTVITFLFTLSRGSYLGFVFMYLAIIVLNKRKRLVLIGMLILAIFILPVILPSRVTGRITETFVPGKVYRPLGRRIVVDESTSARIESWSTVFEKWKKRPILGYGVTGVGFLDTQYPRVLGEVGVVGFFIFVWLMVTIFRHGLYVFNNTEDDWARGLTLGFLAGFVGLLIHAFSASTFIIVRIMEPFWFFAAIVMVLPRVVKMKSPEREMTIDAT
ncbi:MAG: O-antigen ligase family protein [Candidatus Omnitrophica bacterium]|nr:O-antigen ligase family protein [Candidatus Omnitrophota bacterium]